MSRAKHLGTDKKRRIVTAILDGKKPAEIAETEGVAVQTVRNIAAQNRISLKPAPEGVRRKKDDDEPPPRRRHIVRREPPEPDTDIPEPLRGAPTTVAEAREMLAKVAGGTHVWVTEHQEAAVWRFIEAAKRERESTEETTEHRKLPPKLQRLTDALEGMHNRIARDYAVKDPPEEGATQQ